MATKDNSKNIANKKKVNQPKNTNTPDNYDKFVWEEGDLEIIYDPNKK
jgi:hypothetical protein